MSPSATRRSPRRRTICCPSLTWAIPNYYCSAPSLFNVSVKARTASSWNKTNTTRFRVVLAALRWARSAPIVGSAAGAEGGQGEGRQAVLGGHREDRAGGAGDRVGVGLEVRTHHRHVDHVGGG